MVVGYLQGPARHLLNVRLIDVCGVSQPARIRHGRLLSCFFYQKVGCDLPCDGLRLQSMGGNMLSCLLAGNPSKVSLWPGIALQVVLFVGNYINNTLWGSPPFFVCFGS